MSSTDKEEAQRVFWSYSPREIIVFSTKIKHILFFFPN
jgi:hypothetical protein